MLDGRLRKRITSGRQLLKAYGYLQVGNTGRTLWRKRA
jgi:hypothetical protein